MTSAPSNGAACGRRGIERVFRLTFQAVSREESKLKALATKAHPAKNRSQLFDFSSPRTCESQLRTENGTTGHFLLVAGLPFFTSFKSCSIRSKRSSER